MMRLITYSVLCLTLSGCYLLGKQTLESDYTAQYNQPIVFQNQDIKLVLRPLRNNIVQVSSWDWFGQINRLVRPFGINKTVFEIKIDPYKSLTIKPTDFVLSGEENDNNRAYGYRSMLGSWPALKGMSEAQITDRAFIETYLHDVYLDNTTLLAGDSLTKFIAFSRVKLTQSLTFKVSYTVESQATQTVYFKWM
jgi:hypothetical protein